VHLRHLTLTFPNCSDHILTLQHSLAHYERMLSHSHPTYLSQLRTTVASIKVGTDKAVIILTVVSMAVLCIQTLVGVSALSHSLKKATNSPT
jgi:magnesium transporter